MRLPWRFLDVPPPSLARVAALRLTLALFALALVAVTWRLWTPQQVFPRVPLVAGVARLPDALQWVGLAALAAGLAVALLPRSLGRWANGGLLVFAAAAAALIVSDQQRLQPWAYQFILVAIVLALADGPAAFALLRLLVISFYFHSALSKFDYSFLHTLGQQFLSALVGSVGASTDAWSEAWRLRAGLVFPTGELLIAVGLCFAATRRVALWGAITLHLLLLVILGPLGLNHRPGVLLWNIYFIVQDVLLFGGARQQPASEADAALAPVSLAAPWPVAWMIYAAVVLPFLAPTAWFDLWPSWGLYASSAERVALLVHRSEWEQLPDELRAYGEVSNVADDPWIPLRLDRWCLAALGAPIYPQSRFQLGVAEAVISNHALAHRARVVRSSLADRWTGERQHELFVGLPQLLAAENAYLLNSRPQAALLTRQAGEH